MKKICFLFCSVFFLLHFSFAQSPLLKKWDKRFGGTDDDLLYTFQQTEDGGFILGGYSFSGMGGDKTQAINGSYDYWIVKTDGLGNKQWDKDFGGSGEDYLYAVQQTTDGGYILGGYSFSSIGGDKTSPLKGGYDFWIIKTDALGKKKWDKDFGGTLADQLTSLQQTTDGGYILGGYSFSGAGADKTQNSQGENDYWVIKIDSAGKKQWDKAFGGTGDDYLTSLQQTADGGYILGGYTLSGIGGDKTEDSKGGEDYWIIKIDAAGTKQWDKDLGGTYDDYLYSIQQTADHGYILAGTSNSGIGGDKTAATQGGSDYWMIKLDASGNIDWDKDFGGTNDEPAVGNVSITMDGGYLLAGASVSPSGGDKTEGLLGNEQTWVIKTDSLGKKRWDKTAFTNGIDRTGFAVQTAEGCYAFINYSNGGIGGDKSQDNQDASYSTYDYWIIKYCDSTSSLVLPVSDFAVSDTELCGTDCIIFTNQSAHAVSYQWYFPGGTPSFATSRNAYVCYDSAGIFDVKLIASNFGGKDSITYNNYIHVKPVPVTPVVSQTGNTLHCSTDPSYASYQWYDSLALIPGATNPSYDITYSGNYNVLVTNFDGCEIVVGVNVEVGIHNYTDDKSLTISPNPASDRLVIYGNISSRNTISIYNTLGMMIYSVKAGSTGKEEIIDVSGLLQGMYFLQVTSEHGHGGGNNPVYDSYIGKFIKK